VRPVVDADRIAVAVVGLAQVYTLADGWCAELIGEVLGREHACSGGSIRLYWPGLRSPAPEIDNIWDPHAIWSLGGRLRLEILESLGRGLRALECRAAES